MFFFVLDYVGFLWFILSSILERFHYSQRTSKWDMSISSARLMLQKEKKKKMKNLKLIIRFGIQIDKNCVQVFNIEKNVTDPESKNRRFCERRIPFNFEWQTFLSMKVKNTLRKPDEEEKKLTNQKWFFIVMRMIRCSSWIKVLISIDKCAHNNLIRLFVLCHVLNWWNFFFCFLSLIFFS